MGICATGYESADAVVAGSDQHCRAGATEAVTPLAATDAVGAETARTLEIFDAINALLFVVTGAFATAGLLAALVARILTCRNGRTHARDDSGPYKCTRLTSAGAVAITTNAVSAASQDTGGVRITGGTLF
ncbi:MAG: hypothetical protein A2496_15930 [Burkholderiales bacterium RIFOXYC12_FULL_60_6]|nr:MAG: hypothetical protein A2496_15930 [Burkholderiales bacterium RIFOXYC12_FULL_60_6]